MMIENLSNFQQLIHRNIKIQGTKNYIQFFLNLWKELADNFTLVDSYNYDGIEHWGIEHWHTIKYKPKDGGLVDEKFCIKIIDCIIDFIDGIKDIIKIVNSSNDSRF